MDIQSFFFVVSLPVRDEIYRAKELIPLLYQVLVFDSKALSLSLFPPVKTAVPILLSSQLLRDFAVCGG